jgi:glycosyltransferase involved in cell wall biosynthesis
MQNDRFEVKNYPSLERFSSEFSGRALNVCIAAFGIVGPVRNGGIASTYYHLARGLARQGHKVTVLYLKGRKVENGTPEHWIEHYAAFGIDLVYLDFVEQPMLAASKRWQNTYYSFYVWLKANDRFDVIHTSEWRGGAFYCLQAKRLGLAFRNTIFITKTSSPEIWHRYYQMQPIDDPQLLGVAYAEQKCVEWADLVVGGSAHLLGFMSHIGYRLPEGRSYVQPNIIDFSEVIVADKRPDRAYGDVVRSGELVFFGRLEHRKGLEVFVGAINALVARGVMPRRLAFLGKEGAALINQDNAKPLAFIAANARHWPFVVEIVTDRNQPEALSFMCRRDMIAVMPSLIENSSMAVHEALVHKIPFIATAVGGTPELVDPAYHATSLFAPGGGDLVRQLERALREGQPIAAPAFDNDHNLETWYAFHRFVAEHGPETFLLAHGEAANSDIGAGGDASVSYIGYLANQTHARALIEHFANGGAENFGDMLLCLPFVSTAEERAALEALAPPGVELIDCIGATSGEAFNQVREQAKGDILVFDAVGTLNFAPCFAADIRCALNARPETILTTFVTFAADPLDPDAADATPVLFLPLGGDLASQYTTNAAFGVELIALRRETAERIGAFEPYGFNAGIVHEFVTRALDLAVDLDVVPEPDIRYVGTTHPIAARSENYNYLKVKAPIDNASLAMKKVLLSNLGQRTAGRASRASRKIAANAGRQTDEVAWLTNAKTIARATEGGMNRHSVVVGFDPVAGAVRFGLWDRGDLRLSLNGSPVRERVGVGETGRWRIETIHAAPLMATADQIWLRLDFYSNSGKSQATITIDTLEQNVYFVTAARPILWGEDFDVAMEALSRTNVEASGIGVIHQPDNPRSAAFDELVKQARLYMADAEVAEAANDPAGRSASRRGVQIRVTALAQGVDVNSPKVKLAPAQYIK